MTRRKGPCCEKRLGMRETKCNGRKAVVSLAEGGGAEGGGAVGGGAVGGQEQGERARRGGRVGEIRQGCGPRHHLEALGRGSVLLLRPGRGDPLTAAPSPPCRTQLGPHAQPPQPPRRLRLHQAICFFFSFFIRMQFSACFKDIRRAFD